ncbi:MAG: 6-phosphogluconolactonase [Acidobacteriales bacterium]|nr:6-phosphogluconolactonase [Terriglobales bacterium]
MESTSAATRQQIRVLADARQVSQAAANEFARVAHESIQTKGEFDVALAGGSTPRATYEILAKAAAKLPWEKVHIFFGDERCVPPEHADSNYGMARDALLSHVSIPANNVHRMKGEVDAPAAAEQYEGDLRRHFRLSNGALPRFDLVMLGMGDDGHTASLFPGSAGLAEISRLVIANWVEKFKQHRLTLTFPVLNNAAEIMFLVAGAPKAKVMGEIFAKNTPVDRYPVQRIQPAAGHVLWLLDRAAAQFLPARR